MEYNEETMNTLLVEAPASLNAILYWYKQGALSLADCQTLFEREVGQYLKNHAFSTLPALFETLAMDSVAQEQFWHWFTSCEQTATVSERLSVFAAQYELIFVIYDTIPASFTTEYPSQGMTLIPSADYLAS